MFVWSPLFVLIMNFIFTLIISCVGFYKYRKNKFKIVLFVSIAYFIFMISHIISLTVYIDIFESSGILMAIRLVGYLLMLYAVTR